MRCSWSIIALQILVTVEGAGAGALLISLALGLGAAGALAYRRAAFVRSLHTVLSPAPIVFLLLFLLVSPVSKLVIGGAADARLADVSGDAPVVVVVFNEFPVASLMLPDERLDAQRYPNIAELAGDSNWFRHTATVHPQSEAAVPGILTGRWPRPGALPIAADHPQNIFTLLGRGYRVQAAESLTRLCPPDLCRRQTSGLGERLRSLTSDLSVVALHLLLPDDLRERLPSISGS